MINQKTNRFANLGSTVRMRILCAVAEPRRIPRDAAEAIELAKLVLNERGYLVFSTCLPGRSYRAMERTTELWSIQQEQPFTIIAETDQKDWDDQLDVIRTACPQWTKREYDERGSRFWRAVTD